MDPYIEACSFWADFHAHLLNEIKRALDGALPRKYRVRTAQRDVVEFVEKEEKEKRPIYPEMIADEEGLVLRAFIAEEFREKFIEISVVEGERRLVTCLEVLSPSNKRANSASQEQYLRKRHAL